MSTAVDFPPLLRATIVLLALAVAGPVFALDRTNVGRAAVVLEHPAEGPYVGEMVLLKFQAVVHGLAALAELRQPSLVDLDWRQLGQDRIFETDFMGQSAFGYERDMAIYPQRSGEITIAPFVYHLTMVDDDNSRVTVDLSSEPVRLTVRAVPTGTGDAWIPAQSLTVSDQWSTNPDALAKGEAALRTVTIEAKGIGAERLPPPPPMRAPGVISFARQTERVTTLTPQGPVARAIYRWDVKPVSNEPALLPATSIRWFDIGTRQSRIAVIPERRISLASAAATPPREARTHGRPGPPPVVELVTMAIAGLMWGFAALHLLKVIRNGPRQSAATRASMKLLRRSARLKDIRAFRNALVMLFHSEPRTAEVCARRRDLQCAIATLDAHLFGLDGRSAPPLHPLYRDIARAIRCGKADLPNPTRMLLAPIDGP